MVVKGVLRLLFVASLIAVLLQCSVVFAECGCNKHKNDLFAAAASEPVEKTAVVEEGPVSHKHHDHHHVEPSTTRAPEKGDFGSCSHNHDLDEQEHTCSHISTGGDTPHKCSNEDLNTVSIYLARALTQTMNSFKESWDWILMGLLFSVIFQQLVDMVGMSSFITLLGLGGSEKKTGVFSRLSVCVKATILGLLVPLCSCGAMPIAIYILRQGATLSAVVSFLTAAQSAGLDSAFVTYGILGSHAVLGRLLGTSFLATIAGMAVGSVASSTKKHAGEKSCSEKKNKSENIIIRFVGLFEETLPSIAIGIFLSKLFFIALKEFRWLNVLKTLSITEDPNILELSRRLIVVVASVPLQLCEHATVSLAQSLHTNLDMTSGTSLAFLLMAPCTNFATLSLILAHGGKKSARSVYKIVLALSAGALIVSYVVDKIQHVYGLDFMGLEGNEHHDDHHHHHHNTDVNIGPLPIPVDLTLDGVSVWLDAFSIYVSHLYFKHSMDVLYLLTSLVIIKKMFFESVSIASAAAVDQCC